MKQIIRRYLSLVLIFTSILFITPSIAQPRLDTINQTEHVSKGRQAKDSLFNLRQEDIQLIEQGVKSSPLGEVFWNYFGELLILGISVFGYWIRTTLKRYFDKTMDKLTSIANHQTRYSNDDIKNLGEMNANIDECLTKIKDITNAKRVLLYQFSNGSHFFSSIPVLRTTVTNTSKDNTICMTDNYFNYETAKEIVHEILNNEYIICDDTPTVKYTGYTSYLRFAKFKNSYLVRLSVGDNYCGIIEVIEPKTFDYSEVKSYTLSIGHCFDNYNKARLPQKI